MPKGVPQHAAMGLQGFEFGKNWKKPSKKHTLCPTIKEETL